MFLPCRFGAKCLCFLVSLIRLFPAPPRDSDSITEMLTKCSDKIEDVTKSANSSVGAKKGQKQGVIKKPGGRGGEHKHLLNPLAKGAYFPSGFISHILKMLGKKASVLEEPCHLPICLWEYQYSSKGFLLFQAKILIRRGIQYKHIYLQSITT